jgi:uncharacterized protein YjbJ (UPF0337 family)
MRSANVGTGEEKTGYSAGGAPVGVQKLLTKGVTIMSGKTEEVKGRIKEAAGALIGNDKLRDEGKSDQVVGKVKQVAEKAVEEVKEAVKKVTE